MSILLRLIFLLWNWYVKYAYKTDLIFFNGSLGEPFEIYLIHNEAKKGGTG